jgi:hypothetical protein
LRTPIAAVIVLAGAVLTNAGCSNTEDEPAAPPSATAASAAPERAVIDVTISGGQVTPVNQQVRAAVKQPIILRVTSDADDELHVHASPGHTFTVKPATPQSFQFTVDVPGKVDVELHDLNRVVATITVQ